MIKIYTRPGCVYCPQVKKFCDAKGVKYEELPAEGAEYEAAAEGYGYNVPLVVGANTTMMGYDIGKLMQIAREEQDA